MLITTCLALLDRFDKLYLSDKLALASLPSSIQTVLRYINEGYGVVYMLSAAPSWLQRIAVDTGRPTKEFVDLGFGRRSEGVVSCIIVTICYRDLVGFSS